MTDTHTNEMPNGKAPESTAAPSEAEASTSAAASTSTPQPKVFLPPLSNSKSNAPTAGATLTPAPPPPSSSSGSDSDLKPTTEELQALYASTVERNYRLGVNPNAPLMTKAMREREEAKRGGGSGGVARKMYNELRIRFRLPDQTQLEYTLPSSTPLLSLYPLLSSCFTSQPPFTLYTSPPRTEYKEDDVKLRGRKLGDMGWGAAAIVQVRFHGEQAALKEELKSQAKVLEPPTMGMTGDQQQQQGKSAGGGGGGGRTLGGGPSSNTGNAEKKVPKWFKGFKK